MNDSLYKTMIMLFGGIVIYSPTVYVYYLTQKTNKRIDDIESHVRELGGINIIKLHKTDTE